MAKNLLLWLVIAAVLLSVFNNFSMQTPTEQVAVAVDVTHATDCPKIEKKEEGDVRLGKGPVISRGRQTTGLTLPCCSSSSGPSQARQSAGWAAWPWWRRSRAVGT